MGKKFWDRVYKKAYDLYGTTEIPLNTFNKVWILPDKATIYERGTSAFVVDSHLKVMLEEDYTALQHNTNKEEYGTDQLKDEDVAVISGVTSEVVRDVVIPELEREVNEGKTFANLRQIYNSMILATWYKRNLRETLLGKVYVDRNKIDGVDVADKTVKEKIYKQYLEALQKGVFNYIKEDYDPHTRESIPRKYFSGGITMRFAFGEGQQFETVQSLGENQRRALGGIGRKWNELVQLVETAPARQVYQLQEDSIDEFKQWILFNEKLGFVTRNQISEAKLQTDTRAKNAVDAVNGLLADAAGLQDEADLANVAGRVLTVSNALLTGGLPAGDYGAPAIIEHQIQDVDTLTGIMGLEGKLPATLESDNGIDIFEMNADNYMHGLLAFNGLNHPTALVFARVLSQLKAGRSLREILADQANQAWMEGELRGPHDTWLAKYNFEQTFRIAVRRLKETLNGSAEQPRPQDLLARLKTEEDIENRRDYMMEPEQDKPAETPITQAPRQGLESAPAQPAQGPVFQSVPEVRAAVVEAMDRFFTPTSGVAEEKELMKALVSKGEQGINEFAHAIMEDRGISEEEFGAYYVPPTTANVDAFKGETAWGVDGNQYFYPTGKVQFEQERLELMAQVAIQRALGRKVVSTVGIGHVATAMLTITADAVKDFGQEELGVVHNAQTKYRRPLKGKQNAYFTIGYERVGINIGRMFDLKSGKSPVKTPDESVKQKITAAFERGNLSATFLPEVISVADMLVVDTEVHLEKREYSLEESDADLRATEALMTQIGRLANKNTMILVESTTFPGFTRHAVFPIIEREFKKRGILKPGEHPLVGYAPQTMQPGVKWIESLMTIARKISGMTPEAVRAGSEYFETVGFKFSVVTPETAEMTKVVDNAYFYALMEVMNAFMDAAEEMGLNGFSIAKSIAEARPQDRPEIFKRIAQLQVGGYCIPKDMGMILNSLMMFYGMSRLGVMDTFESRLVASNLSDHRAERAVDKHVLEGLAKRGIGFLGTNLAILGTAYKGEISDTRWTGSQRAAIRAAHHGMHVEATDPYAVRWPEIQDLRDVALDWSHGRTNMPALRELQVDYQPEDGGYLNFIDPHHDALVWATPHHMYFGRHQPAERRQITDSAGNVTTFRGASAVEISARMLGLEGRVIVDTYDYFSDRDTKELLALGWDVESYGKGNQQELEKELTIEERIATVAELVNELERLNTDEEFEKLQQEKARKGKQWERAWLQEAIEVQKAKLAYLEAQRDQKEQDEVEYLEAKYESLKSAQELKFAKESEQKALEAKNQYHLDVMRGLDLKRQGLTTAANQAYERARASLKTYEALATEQAESAYKDIVEVAHVPVHKELRKTLDDISQKAAAISTALATGEHLAEGLSAEDTAARAEAAKTLRRRLAELTYLKNSLMQTHKKLGLMFEEQLTPEQQQVAVAELKRINRRPQLALSGRSTNTGDVDLTQMTEAEKERGWKIEIQDRPYDRDDLEAEAKDKQRVADLKKHGVYVIYRDTIVNPETGEELEFVPFTEFVQNAEGKIEKREDAQGFSRARTIKWRKDAVGGKNREINPLFSKFMVKVPLHAVRVANDMTLLLHQGRIELEEGKETYSFGYMGGTYTATVRDEVVEEIKDGQGQVVTEDFAVAHSKNTLFIHPVDLETSEMGRVEFRKGTVTSFSLNHDYVVYMKGGEVSEIRNFEDKPAESEVDVVPSEGGIIFRRAGTDEELGRVSVQENRVTEIAFRGGYRAAIEGGKVRGITDQAGQDVRDDFELKNIMGHKQELYENFDILPYDVKSWMVENVLNRDRILSTVEGEPVKEYYLLMDVNLDTFTEARGRGGILMDAATNEPVVVVTEQGAEQIVMLKAVGSYQTVDPRTLKLNTKRIVRGGRVEHDLMTIVVNDEAIEMVEMHNGEVVEFPLADGNRVLLFEKEVASIKNPENQEVRSQYHVRPMKDGFKVETLGGQEVGTIKWGEGKQCEVTLGSDHVIGINREGQIARLTKGESDITTQMKVSVRPISRVSKSRFGQITGHSREVAPGHVLRQQGTQAYVEGRTSRAPYRGVFTYYYGPYGEEFQQLMRTVPSSSRIGWELLGADQNGVNADFDPVEMTRTMARMQAQILGQDMASVHIAPNPDNIYKRGIWFTDEDSQIPLYNERDPFAAFYYYIGYYMTLVYWDYQGSTNNDYSRIDLAHLHHWVNAFTRYLLDMKSGGVPVVRNPEKFERYLHVQPGDITPDNLRDFEREFMQTVWDEYAAHHVLKNRLRYGYDPALESTFSTKPEYSFDPDDKERAIAFIDNQEKLLRAAEHLVKYEHYDLLYSAGKPFDFQAAYAELARKREAIEILSRQKRDVKKRYIEIYNLSFYKPLEPNVSSVLDYDSIRAGVARLRFAYTKALPTLLREKVKLKLQEQLTGTEARMKHLIVDGQDYQEEWGPMGFVPAYFNAWFTGRGATEITTIADDQPQEVYSQLLDDFAITRQTLTYLSGLGLVTFSTSPVRTADELYFYYEREGQRYYVRVDLRAKETHIITPEEYASHAGPMPSGRNAGWGVAAGFGGGYGFSPTQVKSAMDVVQDGWQTAQDLRHIAHTPDALAIGQAQGLAEFAPHLSRFLLQLMDINQTDNIVVSVRPRDAASLQEELVLSVSREQAADLTDASAIREPIRMIQEAGHDALVQPYVGNVRFGSKDHQRLVFRVTTQYSYPGRSVASEISAVVTDRGNVTESPMDQHTADYFYAQAPLAADAEWQMAAFTAEDKTAMRHEAERALYGLNLGLAPENQLQAASLDIAVDIDEQGQRHYWVVGVSEPEAASAVSDERIPDLLVEIVDNSYDESPRALVAQVTKPETFQAIVGNLRDYIARPFTGQDQMLYIKQERAIIVLADVIWDMKNKGLLPEANLAEIELSLSNNPSTQQAIRTAIDALEVEAGQLDFERYLAYVQPFINASSEREMMDFEKAKAALMADIPQPEPGTLQYTQTGGDQTVHEAEGPMRAGISSQNGADNWTTVKTHGAEVLNVALNLDGKLPVKVETAEAAPGEIVLEIIGGLPGNPYRLVLNRDNIGEFYTYQDAKDPFRLLKYALIFTGIVRENPSNPLGVLEDIDRFMGGHGLHLRVTSFGPSRGGLASSTSVSEKILESLYHASGQANLADDTTLRGSLTILMENRLGLKSGRQDVEGSTVGGLKILRLHPTAGFVAPGPGDLDVINLTPEQLADTSEHLLFVDTGIPRAATTAIRRNLAMRNLSYLSRATGLGFDAHLRSKGIHDRIVEAFETQNWAALGPLLSEYMYYRERIDSGATWSIYDENAGEKVLLWIFDQLEGQGLITGGFYTGQMGGGISVSALTPKALEVLPDGKRRFEVALEELRERATPDGRKPYANLRIVNYSINAVGTTYKARQGTLVPYDQAVAQYEEDMKPKGYSRITRTVEVAGQPLEVIDSEVLNPRFIEAPPRISYEGGRQAPSEITAKADEELKAGRVGMITVAGGRKSRAGLDIPAGAHPIAPLSGKELFRVQAEELLAAQKRYGHPIPWFIMTSALNDADTRAYFEDNGYFGLDSENVIFIQQDSVPAFEAGTQTAAMKDAQTALALPNGHGGIYAAMKNPQSRTGGGRTPSVSALDEARQRGLTNFYYNQIDNPLPAIDTTLLGEHIDKGSDFTSPVIRATQPEDQNRGRHYLDTATGQMGVIDYNQPAAAFLKGRPGFEYVHIGRHILSMGLLERAEQPPYHMARNKRGMIYREGQVQQGRVDKFESFMFDVLDQAHVTLDVALDRAVCCANFKEMTGPTSPGASGAAMSEYHKVLVRRMQPTAQLSDESTLELSYAALAPEGDQQFVVGENFQLVGEAQAYFGGRNVRIGDNVRIEGRLFVNFEDAYNGTFEIPEGTVIPSGANVTVTVGRGQQVVYAPYMAEQEEGPDAQAHLEAIGDAEAPMAVVAFLGQPGQVGWEAQKKYDTLMGRQPPGGIDFNPSYLDLQIRRDSNAVPLPVDLQPIPEIDINGFVPVIINIAPVLDFNFLLGFSEEDKPDGNDEQLSLLNEDRYGVCDRIRRYVV